ncbi:hypothetical protein DIPPA_13266 [Diplonema papillatum]|nr:hypothetical protein DIPPA_13266 [Diplonema papillatum]
MGCTASDQKKPGGAAAPVAPAQGGFGAPVKKEQQRHDVTTGVPDLDLYNSLPPCDVAEDVKKIHPNFGGKPNGVQVLEALYSSIRNLQQRARDEPEYRLLQLASINREPEAIKVANWAGFKTDVENPSQLTAEEGVGYFVAKRKSTEYDICLQYIEAMLGGVPNVGARNTQQYMQ